MFIEKCTKFRCEDREPWSGEMLPYITVLCWIIRRRNKETSLYLKLIIDLSVLQAKCGNKVRLSPHYRRGFSSDPPL